MAGNFSDEKLPNVVSADYPSLLPAALLQHEQESMEAARLVNITAQNTSILPSATPISQKNASEVLLEDLPLSTADGFHGSTAGFKPGLSNSPPLGGNKGMRHHDQEINRKGLGAPSLKDDGGDSTMICCKWWILPIVAMILMP